MWPTPRKSATISHIARSEAPRLTSRMNRLPFAVPLKQPSAATKPPRNAASASVSGCTVVVGAAEHSAAHGLLTARNGARRPPFAVPIGMGEVVREELVAPLLELTPLLRGQKERLRKRDRRVPLRPDGVDAKHADRLPMTPAAAVVLNRAEPEKGTQRFEDRKVTARHRHAEDELQAAGWRRGTADAVERW
jgi:hypothetical protein